MGVTPVAVGAGPMELQIPAIEGIGGSLIYLVARYEEQSIYDVDFKPIPGVDQRAKGVGLTFIDHLTHNVTSGNMDKLAGYYERLFNFRPVQNGRAPRRVNVGQAVSIWWVSVSIKKK